MSSLSGARFSPPQSAQPYRSIFGGPSSQDVADLVPYPETQTGSGDSQQDLDVIMEEEPIENDHSDATYVESNDDEQSGSDADSYASVPQSPEKPRRQRQQKQPLQKTTELDYQRDSETPPAHSYRPNRFRGPESTWRRLTAEERQNAQALEDIRARDLAAHLYNAYALRVRAREIARRATETNDQLLDEMDTFAPPKRWTAWPLPSAEVPRPDEEVRKSLDDAWTLRMQPDPRPSAELEESVMAFMLRTAKERFMAREWDYDSKPFTSHRRKRSASQHETQDESTAWESEREGADGAPLRPTVQTDDDKSRRQLRPLTRNILSRFDDLLLGLHRARKGGAAADDSSASDWQTDTESVMSGSSSRKRKVNSQRDRSLSRGRKRTRRSSFKSGSSDARSRSTHVSSEPESSVYSSSQATSRHRSLSQHSSRSRGRSVGSDRRRSASRIRLGIRDWSEVLGVASMIGWPPAVVMRTAQRCSALFGEDMAFQVLKEGHIKQDIQDDDTKIWKYEESESEPEVETDLEPESEAEAEISQPSRSQSRRPRSRAASIKGGSTSRANSTAPEDAGDGSRPKGKGEHRKQDLICPIRACSRHDKGFSRTWNLNLHMKRMHPNYRSKSEGRSSTGTRGEDDIDNE
ncbi:uncharacterized protein BO88DRAFT_432142 [Aspergillus vadensis CBS 113365]|uniref:Uncharacterized protein n=1 Tax=Aspergillus vadensis (strain CBS 113365 / IMI 142717 / IBT 24658) TaxID=1448311 RepID=A0A319BRJ0_ASPVC|nr:hypothetical protein BO88DRAFT_432142 [Aspergillus vadensis CBS 113365]PYH73780.1 hypothetical protein BO88DRAFT_432142 [Aspergillus vadensis CBS 113365]